MSQTTSSRPKFELIDDVTPAPEAPSPPAPTPVATDQETRARQLLTIALRSLSARAMTAVTNLFSLFLVTLVFVLFGRVLDEPNSYKLGAVGGFAVFCLLIDIVRRKT